MKTGLFTLSEYDEQDRLIAREKRWLSKPPAPTCPWWDRPVDNLSFALPVAALNLGLALVLLAGLLPPNAQLFVCHVGFLGLSAVAIVHYHDHEKDFEPIHDRAGRLLEARLAEHSKAASDRRSP